jgi:hypothetical protein
LESKKVKAPMGISLDRIALVEGVGDGPDESTARGHGRSGVKIEEDHAREH